MREIFILASNFFQKSIRKKLVFVFLLFSLFIVFFSLILEQLTFVAQAKIIKDLSLAGIFLFCSLIAIFLSTETLTGEVEKKTIYIILSKPVSREKFLCGSFLGTVLTTTVSLLITGGATFALIYLKYSLFDWEIAFTLFFIWLETFLIISIGIMFSSFSSSSLTGSFLCFFLFILGHLVPQLHLIKNLMPGKLLRGIITFLYLLLPNFTLFNPRENATRWQNLDVFSLGKIVLYTFSYALICLIISCIIFKRRQL